MIKGVIFDLDGTITKPFLDFEKIRLEIGGELTRVRLLEQIEAMQFEEQKQRANRILSSHEIQAAGSAEFNEGIEESLALLDSMAAQVGIITRNCEESTRLILDKLGLKIADVITRESGFPHKPDPAAVLHLLDKWGFGPEEALMIGDHYFDVDAGKAAGLRTIFLTNGKPLARDPVCDYVIKSATELPPILKDLTHA